MLNNILKFILPEHLNIDICRKTKTKIIQSVTAYKRKTQIVDYA